MIELKMNSVVARNSTRESRITRFMFEQSSGVPSFQSLSRHNMVMFKDDLEQRYKSGESGEMRI
jgi:hypothetical protein